MFQFHFCWSPLTFCFNKSKNKTVVLLWSYVRNNFSGITIWTFTWGVSLTTVLIHNIQWKSRALQPYIYIDIFFFNSFRCLSYSLKSLPKHYAFISKHMYKCWHIYQHFNSVIWTMGLFHGIHVIMLMFGFISSYLQVITTCNYNILRFSFGQEHMPLFLCFVNEIQ